MKVWVGVVVATMLAAGVAAQSQTLEPLFRAGLGVSATFEANPVSTTVQPLKIELAVAETKATTAREKAIVAAYNTAVFELTMAALGYEGNLSSAEFSAKMLTAKAAASGADSDRLAVAALSRPEQIAREKTLPKIEAALKSLEDAQALYTAKPTTAKPATKPAAKQ